MWNINFFKKAFEAFSAVASLFALLSPIQITFFFFRPQSFKQFMHKEKSGLSSEMCG